VPGPVLITGAAGFAGSHLLDLLEPGERPLVAWRRPGEPLPEPPTGARSRWMAIDILDRDAVRQAVRDVRPALVYHLAGVAHMGGSWDRTPQTLEVNVLGTHHLLDAVADLDPAVRVLITGSALVYREQSRALVEDDPIGPASPYGLSKLAQEMAGAHAARDRGLPVLLTRPFNHIGPRQSPLFFASGVARQVARIEQGLAEPIIEVGNLDARRDLTDVRDTVRAYQAILERGLPGRVYNVCAGQAHRIGDILDRLLSRARVRIGVRQDPERYRPHDAPLVLGDHSRLSSELGWAPRIPVEQTLTDLLEYWRRTTRTDGPTSTTGESQP
jgi:GDP-4-dehydro-6-deoxy-D-mannose reductase